MANGSIIKVLTKNNVTYFPLDYLEATGTQYIETLSNFTNTKRLKIKWLSSSDIVQYGHDIMGKNTSSDTYNLIVQERYDSSKLVLINNKPNARIDTTQTSLKEHTLEIDWRTLPYKYILDGVETTKNSAIQDFGNYNLFKASDNSRLAKARVYYYECYDSNNELSFNLIPAEKLDGTLGMLDLVNGTFYTNSGSGTFSKGNYIQVERIYMPPLKAKTYEKLEYIEGSGNEYINTGVSLNKNAFKLKFKMTPTNKKSIGYHYVYGNGISGNYWFSYEYTTNNQSYWNIAKKTIQGKHNLVNGDTYEYDITYDNNIFNVHIKKDGVAYFDVNNLNYGSTIYDGSTTPIAFLNNTVGGTAQKSAKVYYLQMWDDAGTNLVRDFIPVKRLSDNAIGLLDTLTNTFYGNSGTGAFTGQSLATPEYVEEYVYRVDYIESSGTQYINLGNRGIDKDNHKIEVKYAMSELPSGTAGAYIYSLTQTSRANPFDLYAQSGKVIFRCNGASRSIPNPDADLNTHTLTINYNDKTLKYDSTNGTLTTNPAQVGEGEFDLFRNNNDTSYSKAKIYYLKKWIGNDLEIDLIPVKYGTEYCMLDLVSANLYYNAGTGTFSGGDITEVKKIEQVIINNNIMYFPLDYLETNGNQYIDTGITPTGNSKVELELKITSGNPSWASIFGSSSSSFGLQRSSNANSWATYLLGSYNLNLGSWAENTNYNLVFDGKNSKFIANGTSYNINKGTTAPSATLKLFTAWNLESGIKAQVKKVKLYDNDELQLDLIPAERVSDNVKGMLDTLSGTFYTNSGSGTFGGNRKTITLKEYQYE